MLTQDITDSNNKPGIFSETPVASSTEVFGIAIGGPGWLAMKAESCLLSPWRQSSSSPGMSNIASSLGTGSVVL